MSTGKFGDFMKINKNVLLNTTAFIVGAGCAIGAAVVTSKIAAIALVIFATIALTILIVRAIKAVVNHCKQKQTSSEQIQTLTIETVTIEKIVSLEKEGYHSFKNTTFAGENNKNNIDFVNVFPEQGLAYIADGTGHAVNEIKYNLFSKFWPQFDEEIKKLPSCANFDEWQKAVEQLILKESSKFESQVASNSSLIITQLLQGDDGKCYLFYYAIGDSDLFCLHQDDMWTELTYHVERPIKENNKPTQRSGNFGGNCTGSHKVSGLIEVKPGDKIIALTDGATVNDCMDEEDLKGIFKNSGTPEELLDQLWNRLQKEVENGKIDSNNRKKSDDVSAFIMVVPNN